MNHIEYLHSVRACYAAVEYARQYPTLAAAWDACDNVDWMLWVCDRALPMMYALGFDHNNCLGCVKATSAGYWNRTRNLFPDVFARRARQSRLLGVKLVRLGETRDADGKRRSIRGYLDELPPDADAPDDDIECGPVCQRPKEES